MAKKPKKPVDDPKSKKAKAKAKQREEEVDDEEDEDEEDDAPAQKKPKSGVYVGLGAITLIAFITAGVFFYLDKDFHEKQPPTVNIDVYALSATAPKAASN
jgi:hypothetical protein